MPKPVEVKAVSHYKIWVRFSDDLQGIVDLGHLAGKGIFSRWKEKNVFEKVRIDPESGTVAWDDDIDLCPDVLYMQMTGKTIEEVYPNINSKRAYA